MKTAAAPRAANDRQDGRERMPVQPDQSDEAAGGKGDQEPWLRPQCRGVQHPGQAVDGVGSAAVRPAKERSTFSVAQHSALSGVAHLFDAAICRHASMNLSSASANLSRFNAARATSSKSVPAGTSSWWRRKTSRRRRFAALRDTAGPTAAVDATTPTLTSAGGVVAVSPRRRHHKVKAPRSRRQPWARTLRKSSWRRRCCSGRKCIGKRLKR